jgi:hypothetical protein
MKARVLINLLPGAPRGPEERGELYQHFAEIFGVLRARAIFSVRIGTSMFSHDLGSEPRNRGGEGPSGGRG